MYSAECWYSELRAMYPWSFAETSGSCPMSAVSRLEERSGACFGVENSGAISGDRFGVEGSGSLQEMEREREGERAKGGQREREREREGERERV